MTERILILGGTREAAALAKELVACHGTDAVITSLAGRTKEPRPVAGRLRIGGFGGVEGLSAYLRAEHITRVIDATHPFAEQISANAIAACAQVNVPLETRIRPPWQRQAGDHWLHVPTITDAVAAIPQNACVLLALGSQHITPFANRSDVHFVIRMVDPPAALLPFAKHSVLIGRPSSDPIEEAQMLRENGITHIVCRNSGGAGAYAKIEAARSLALPVLMIARHGASY
ncbi:MAG: cobalt-precorrin-6A reductase [Pseudomonadota bacterium]